VTALLGTAERLPLADGVADAVVCAQAFHWFATAAAVAEIRRVLKPGGVLGLIWNVRDQSVDWVAKITTLIAPYEGDAPRYDNGEWRAVFPAQGFGPLHETRVPHAHTGPSERVIVDRIASISFIAALPSGERQQLLERVRELIASTPTLAGRDEVSFPYVTMAYHCVRLPA
jgi:SAM-dependent methyltransferase